MKAKDRIRVPPMLQPKLERLVKAHAEAFKTSEEDARRMVELAVMTQGIAALERREVEEGGV